MEEIWKYSMPAIQVLLDMARDRHKEQLHDLAIAVRHTQGTDAGVWKKFIKSLEVEDGDRG